MSTPPHHRWALRPLPSSCLWKISNAPHSTGSIDVSCSPIPKVVAIVYTPHSVTMVIQYRWQLYTRCDAAAAERKEMASTTCPAPHNLIDNVAGECVTVAVIFTLPATVVHLLRPRCHPTCMPLLHPTTYLPAAARYLARSDVLSVRESSNQ